MAHTKRPPSSDLIFEQLLATEPFAHGFFLALRRLECRHRNRRRLGEAIRADDEPLRLGLDPSMAFAPATISSYGYDENGRPRLGVYFFGLLGPNAPLPLHLTEYVYERQRHHHDESMRAFLDVFHHRMLSLFYRAWANAQPVVHHDRPEGDRFQQYVASLFGLGTPQLRRRDAVDDTAKAYFAGRFADQRKNPEGLLAVLQTLFGLPFSLQEFVGEWVSMPPQSCLRLGESPRTGCLDKTWILGGAIWSCRHKFRLTAGPLGYEDYASLLPGGARLQRLIDLVRLYVGDELKWELKLLLDPCEIPSFTLGRFSQLDRNMYFCSRTPEHPSGEMIINPEIDTKPVAPEMT